VKVDQAFEENVSIPVTSYYYNCLQMAWYTVKMHIPNMRKQIVVFIVWSIFVYEGGSLRVFRIRRGNAACHVQWQNCSVNSGKFCATGEFPLPPSPLSALQYEDSVPPR